MTSLNQSAIKHKAGLLPNGAYFQTCENTRMKGAPLLAGCVDRKGVFGKAEIPDAFDRDGLIANFDGQFRCDFEDREEKTSSCLMPEGRGKWNRFLALL